MQINHMIQSGNLERPMKALILIHGRGGSADDIIGLSEYLAVDDYLLIGPQADENTWYPHSFLAPQQDNQPFLDRSLQRIADAVALAKSKGVEETSIYFLGFSQGACLALEYTARNAQRYGGIVAFTGGLIGQSLSLENYNGDFDGTPIFIGSSDPDFHVPVERVQDSTVQLRKMGALVTERIYPEMGHRISKEEIILANTVVFNQGDPRD
ncbi:MAG TPA: dienelactone hydrolase family protein [Candidatus Sphingobacterium stercorigallinarum]|nr:dienelactone hydrolase family protein [Candidatus Sphingobacterium stercorigallinarum]